MDGSGRSQDTRTGVTVIDDTLAKPERDRAILMQFESLGGSGHGPEFAIFQHAMGVESAGLLAWADLGYDLLVNALEARFDGVGLDDNTIVFAPDHSDEWWSKDKRYWMAMRTFVKTAEADADKAREDVCRRLQARRQTLIAALQAGETVFVYKNLIRNLTETEINRLHAAVRAYGPSTLFYVCYADADHPAGTVTARADGLLIGYIEHFTFSPDNTPLGSVSRDWMELCERAYRLVTPAADPAPEPPAQRPRRVAHAGRQIVLIGNCQMQAMAGLYKRFVAGRTKDIVEHVPSYQDLSEAHRSQIQQADLIVEQLFDLKPRVEDVSTTTPRLFIPMVTAAFLWPFAGSPHPKNSFYPFLSGGPYGGEAADSYLNRLIMAGTDPEEAVETYANLDVNSRVNLNRLLELVMDRQRNRDEAAGYQIAGLMEQHFRTEQIFLSPYHPNVRIATALASQFFRQLGAEQDEIERMVNGTRITPFPKGELPFHPSVVRHFGLTFVGPDRRYRFMNEGLFTFREYALRYMRYEWNAALEEGMHLVHAGKPDQARGRLAAALEQSPQSAAAHNAMSHILGRNGDHDGAVAAARRAVAIEPDSASYRANLGTSLGQARQLDAAVAELRAAIEIDPVEPHYRVLLAHRLRQAGDLDEACAQVRAAIALDPYAANLRADLAGFLESKGDLDGAVSALREAVTLQPANEVLHHRLAHLLGRLGRVDEAIAMARVAVDLEPDSSRARIVLSDLLLRQGNPADALNEAYVAAVTEPDNAHAYGHLGHVLAQTGDLAAAEAAFRRAARLDPRSAHYQHELSVVLNRQQRFDEAVAAARQATVLEARNPHRCVHLANLFAQRGDYASAQAAQLGAVRLEPEVAVFRVGLSDLFARAGQYQEAVAEAQTAVEFQPKSLHALQHLGHVAQLAGEFALAGRALERALEIEPGNEGLLRRVGALRERVAV
jgi:tetratricopeptide (TPR) repeat protein